MSIKDKYTIQAIKPFECHEWLLEKHYAKRIPSISYAFGLYNDRLIGVITFGTPASSTLLKGICGEEYASNVKELNRLVYTSLDANLGSFFVSQSIQQLPKPLIIVSYADTSQGHHGYIYQACNFLYTGLSSKFLDPQVKGLEHQHHATYAHGMSNTDLQLKYGDRLYFKERARKHRYILFIGSKAEKKTMHKALKYPVEPYPKGNNTRYDASYEPTTQNLLF